MEQPAGISVTKTANAGHRELNGQMKGDSKEKEDGPTSAIYRVNTGKGRNVGKHRPKGRSDSKEGETQQ